MDKLVEQRPNSSSVKIRGGFMRLLKEVFEACAAIVGNYLARE
jgi:hypothetical protein